MKKLICIFLISLLLFIGCNDNSNLKDDKFYTKWESVGIVNHRGGFFEVVSMVEVLKRYDLETNEVQYKNVKVCDGYNKFKITYEKKRKLPVEIFERKMKENEQKYGYKLKKVALKEGNKTEVKI